MGVFNKLNKSGWVFAVILVALALFVLSDLISSFGRGGTVENPVVGEIQGFEIKLSEFDVKVKRREEIRMQQQQLETLTDELKESVNDEIWEEVFKDIVVHGEYKKLGLQVGDKELTKLLFTEDAHMFTREYFKNEQGQFHPSEVTNFFNQIYPNNPQAQEFFNSVKDAIISNVLSDKYKTLLQKGYYVTALEAEFDFMEYTRNVNANVVGLKIADVKDEEVSFTETELKDYYKKNKKDFKTEESAELEYVSWLAIPSHYDTLDVVQFMEDEVEDFKNAEDDSAYASVISEKRIDHSLKPIDLLTPAAANAVIEAEKGDVIGPVQNENGYSLYKLVDIEEIEVTKYKTRQIVFQKDWSNKKDSLAIIEKARSLIPMFKEDFKGLVKNVDQYGAFIMDPEGESQWWDFNMQMPEIVKAMSNAKVGEPVIVATVQGIHVIELIYEPNNKLYSVIEIFRSIQPMEQTLNETYYKASLFRAKMSDGSDGKFETAIEESGLAKRIVSDLKPGQKNIPGIEQPAELVKWVFERGRVKHDVSDIFSLGNRFIVAHVVNLKKEGVPEFEEVKELVQVEVIKEKKLQFLHDKMKAEIKKGIDPMDYAIKFGSVSHPVYNGTFKNENLAMAREEYKIWGAMFGLKSGTVSNPVMGKEMCFVLFINELNDPEVPQNLESRKSIVNSNFFNTLETQILKTLKYTSDIKDFRSKYY